MAKKPVSVVITVIVDPEGCTIKLPARVSNGARKDWRDELKGRTVFFENEGRDVYVASSLPEDRSPWPLIAKVRSLVPGAIIKAKHLSGRRIEVPEH